MSKHFLLVGMSALEVAEHARLEDAARRLGGDVAYLQLGDPSLSAELTRLADRGATTISLAGVSLGAAAFSRATIPALTHHSACRPARPARGSS